jgi:hypothetical protein
LPISWKRWNRFECAVDEVVCTPDDGWKYHPKHVEQFSDINKLCNFASCWIYTYIGILLGVYLILHISRIRIKEIRDAAKKQSCAVEETQKRASNIDKVKGRKAVKKRQRDRVKKTARTFQSTHLWNLMRVSL